MPYAAGMPSEPSSTTDLPAAVSGERFDTQGRAGRVTGYVAGSGPPLLLVHSVNAAASAYEVRPLYERLSAVRPTYAIDLPGFGRSDRSDRAYLPRLMTDAVSLAVDAIRKAHGGGPIDALGLSLSCEFLARAACERPSAFRTLALVSPTGLGRKRFEGPPGGNRGLTSIP